MGGVGCICGPQSGLGVEVMSNVGQVAFDFVRSHATSVSRPGIVGSMQLDLHRSL